MCQSYRPVAVHLEELVQEVSEHSTCFIMDVPSPLGPLPLTYIEILVKRATGWEKVTTKKAAVFDVYTIRHDIPSYVHIH